MSAAEISAAARSQGGSGAEPKAPTVRVNVEQASYSYTARRHAAPIFTLEATTFQARDREVVAILGPNASGKSTLLRLVAGSMAPMAGRVELDGFETSRLDPRTRAQRIAMVQPGKFVGISRTRRRLRAAGPAPARTIAVV